TKVEDVSPDHISQGRADQNIGREVVAAKQASGGNRACCPIRQDLHPSPGIFTGHYARHRPHEHGMTTLKRRIESMVIKEIAITSTFARALAARDALHARLDPESMGQGSEV